MNIKLIKNIFVKTLPVMAGYIVLGTGFGILLKVNGYGLIYALAMSLFIFAGSMQFVGVSLIAGRASLISIAITTLMVNARHLFYGVSMIEKYKGAGLKKPYLMHALTDETYSLLCTDDVPDNIDPHKYYFLISLFDQSYWVLGSVIGSIIGSFITFNTAGIDFSMTALFVTVLVEQWMKTKEHRPALIGIFATTLCLMIFKSSNFLIPSMLMITILLTLFRHGLEKTEAENER